MALCSSLMEGDSSWEFSFYSIRDVPEFGILCFSPTPVIPVSEQVSLNTHLLNQSINCINFKIMTHVLHCFTVKFIFDLVVVSNNLVAWI